MSDANGTWDIITKSPMGDQPAKLTLSVADDGAITGQMAGAQGAVDLQDGKVEGDKYTWKAQIPSPPITLEFSASVDGDAISGSVKLGAFGTASFEGTRC